MLSFQKAGTTSLVGGIKLLARQQNLVHSPIPLPTEVSHDEKLQMKLSVSPSHSILTPGKLVPGPTQNLQAPGRSATGVPIFLIFFFLSHCYDSTRRKAHQRKQESNPGSAPLEADTLTTRPTRRSHTLTTRPTRPSHTLTTRPTRPSQPSRGQWVSRPTSERLLLVVVGCLTSQQHASVSQGRICTDNFTCCHTEMEAADPTFHLTQSQNTDTGLTSPSADPIIPGAWQGSHWSANF